MFRSKGAVVAAAVFACALPSEVADACGNGVEFRVNEAVQLVAQVERKAQEGSPAEALKLISQRHPVKSRRLGASDLDDRVFRVAARAVVRLDGEVDPAISQAGERPPSGPEARDKELAWATHVLRSFTTRNPDDPIAATDLAEALARTDEGATDALTLLSSLEDRDLVSTAQGYEALARLRSRTGDGDPGYLGGPLDAYHGAMIAIEKERCRSMTKDPAVCADPRPAPAAGTGS